LISTLLSRDRCSGHAVKWSRV